MAYHALPTIETLFIIWHAYRLSHRQRRERRIITGYLARSLDANERGRTSQAELVACEPDV